MIVVIIAGGSGTRLWPLSTSSYPKHLLNINDEPLSLVQNTYKRARQVTTDDKIYVATEASHVQYVKDQLSDLPDGAFVVEPARRGTAHCILAALAEIEKNHDPEEPIAFMAADHYIRDMDGFAQSFKLADTVVRAEQRILLVGIEPDFPATGFGYIQKGDPLEGQQFVYNVSNFKEKPDFATAQEYLNSGRYLWNAGYFVGSVKAFRDKMNTYAPDLLKNYESLLNTTDEAAYKDLYLGFENIAIDYMLIEKVPDLLVIPASFDWMDLGSFNDMYNAVDKDNMGNHLKGNVEIEDAQNIFVENFEDKPVAVIGLDNVVVVNTPDGVLVLRRDLSQKVGDIAKRIQKKEG
jgi:mannose-1-phosphate guanylyltransferase